MTRHALLAMTLLGLAACGSDEHDTADTVDVPETVEPDTVDVPETVEPDTVEVPETVEPDTVEPPETIEPDTVEVPETIEPDTVEPPETIEPDTIEVPDVPTCQAESYLIGSAPDLAVYMMLDQSGSMDEAVAGGASRWTLTVGAIKAFLAREDLGYLSIGIQYFGVPPEGPACPSACAPEDEQACLACGGLCFQGMCLPVGGDSCEAADYAEPAVEIGPLAETGPAIAASLDQHGPSTGTPTSAALAGLIDHAFAWAQAHDGQPTVAVLVTDGEPNQCVEDIGEVAAIAADGLELTPSIRTFVLGVGPNLDALDQIAAAGGTERALLVEDAAVSTTLTDTLAAVAYAGVCSLATPVAPAGGTLTLGDTQLVEVADEAACTTNGWYTTADAGGARITLCPETCAGYRGGAATLSLCR